MRNKADAHKWEFKPRFRRHAFGWKSQPAITRIKQAVAEIKKVAKDVAWRDSPKRKRRRSRPYRSSTKLNSSPLLRQSEQPLPNRGRAISWLLWLHAAIASRYGLMTLPMRTELAARMSSSMDRRERRYFRRASTATSSPILFRYLKQSATAFRAHLPGLRRDSSPPVLYARPTGKVAREAGSFFDRVSTRPG
jgi:hypothetical protein